MKRFTFLILILMSIFVVSSCGNNDDDSGTSINPDIELEKKETIIKRLYASLSDEYTNTTIIDDYYIELTDKNNFYFTAKEKEMLNDEVLYDNSVYYKGTYEETSTKLLLNYNEYNVLGINEFSIVDGLYILEDRGIAFSTRNTNLSESSYIGLYYSIIDEEISSIELKSNGEAIIKNEDETIYSNYKANVSNIYIRSLGMHLILNGQELLMGDIIYKRFNSQNVEVIGYNTNLKQSLMIGESLDLRGKYVDVYYSDYTKIRHYLVDSMFDKYVLKEGLNDLTINLDNRIYEYEVNVINPISFTTKYSYKGNVDQYFEFEYKSDLILLYKSIYNVNVTLFDKAFNIIETKNKKIDSILFDGVVGEKYYLKVEGFDISIDLELLSKTSGNINGYYEYKSDNFGLIISFDGENHQYNLYSLSENEQISKSGNYTISNNKIVIDNISASIYESGRYIVYNGYVLSKKLDDKITYGYLESDLNELELDLKKTYKVYLSKEGITRSIINESEIVGFNKDFSGNYLLVYKINDYYMSLKFERKNIISYFDENKVSNINSNIFYSFNGNGNYYVNVKNAMNVNVIVYDKDFNVLEKLDKNSVINIMGDCYFRVINYELGDISLIINKIVEESISGIYKNGDSVIDFDNMLFDGKIFTYNDKEIIADSTYQYTIYGDLIKINDLYYKSGNTILEDGIYQLESTNEVIIIEINNLEATYLYSSLKQDLITEYDTNLSFNNNYYSSKFGDIYTFSNNEKNGIILVNKELNLDFPLIKKELDNVIVDTQVTFNKTTFFTGDELNKEDVDILALYSNGNIQSISVENAIISYFTTKTVGEYVYSLKIGNNDYSCNYKVLPKERIYLNKEYKDSDISSKVYEFKANSNGDYLISFETDVFQTFDIYIYSDSSLKNLIRTKKSTSKYISELINSKNGESVYIQVELTKKSDIRVLAKIDQSLVGTYEYNDSRVVFNSNKIFEYRDLENGFRYSGNYYSNGLNNYILTVTRQYKIEGSSFNEIDIMTSQFEIKSYGGIIVLEENIFQTQKNIINYVGTYYSITDQVSSRIELTDESSLGGGLLKINSTNIDSTNYSNSFKYSVSNSLILSNKLEGYIYEENGYVFINYNGTIYIKLSKAKGINAKDIQINNIYDESDFGYISILNNDSTFEKIKITKDLIVNYKDVIDSKTDTLIVQYKNLAFTITI